MANYCFNTNNLHEQIKIYPQLCLLINPMAIPHYSFDNLAILCFPNVWIHTHDVQNLKHAVFFAPIHNFLVQYGQCVT